MKKDRRSIVVRVVAILMAALMVLGIGTMLFQTVFASDGIPVTGSSPRSKLPIFILIGAVVLIVIVAVIPKLIKKK